MMEKQEKMPDKIKNMPNPSLIWRFLSRERGVRSFTGAGLVFLFFIVLAIETHRDVKIQYYKSKKTYPDFVQNLFCAQLSNI